MINKIEVIDFFNKCAPSWDAEMIRDDEIISEILANAGFNQSPEAAEAPPANPDSKRGLQVLDVACGTGVLFDDYLSHGAGYVLGVDISPEMVKIAQEKYADSSAIEVVCADVMELETSGISALQLSASASGAFDIAMVYNAFPHFPDGAALIARLAACLKPGGRLSVAHGMSRAKIDAHHSGSANHVSNGLMPADELAAVFAPYFDVNVVIDNDRMYQVAGTLRQK